MVDEELELVVEVMEFVHNSLSPDMLLDVAQDLQNLHISFPPVSIRPLKYTGNSYIHIWKQN